MRMPVLLVMLLVMVMVFPVTSHGSSPAEQGTAKGKYVRSVEYYKIPNVTLLNQDGKKVKLKQYFDSGKPVVVDFIYTTCTTICPILSAGFVHIQNKLGDGAKNVQLVSISIDPGHDRPEQLKAYLSRYNAAAGWDFLTGSRDDIALVLKAFDAKVVDKMDHLPLYLLRGPESDEWVRIKGLIGGTDLIRELKGVMNK